MIPLFRGLSEPRRGKPLVCDQVYLRPPARGDWNEWAVLRSESRGHLEPWEPAWGRDALSRKAFMRRLRVHAVQSLTDRGYVFFIFERRGDALVGGVSLNHVRRGIGQTASLGYWIGEPHARRGYMTDALCALLPFAFEGLGLHRLSAAVLERNAASQRVLEKVGFVREGVARKYLRIADEWQDHAIYAMLSTDERPAAAMAAAADRKTSRRVRRRLARRADPGLARALGPESGG